MAGNAWRAGTIVLAVAALITAGVVWRMTIGEPAAKPGKEPSSVVMADPAESGPPVAEGRETEAPTTTAAPAAAVTDSAPVGDAGSQGMEFPSDPAAIETATQRPGAESGGGATEIPSAPTSTRTAATDAETLAARAAGDDASSREASAAPPSPALDIVRIEPDGAGLVAGRATPESEVEIVVEDKVVGRARAGADGGFVAMITTAPNVGAQRVVAREAAPKRTPGLGASNPTPPRAGPGAVQTGDSAPVFVIGASEPDAAPLVVGPTDEGVRILQGPARGPTDAVALDRITYDASGHVVLSGRAPEGAEVRIYFDEKAAGAVEAADDGSWTFRPGDELSPGTYRLRLDEVDATGNVSSRLETPFRREAITPGEAPRDEMIVQRGDSLWRIAENVYGAGLRYTLIYDANSHAIRDPDLIYPGQIFDLPGAPAPE